MKLKTHEKNRRSLIKAVSYRMLSIFADAVFAYLFTRDVLLTAGIVGFINFYSTGLYFLHERIWAYIGWGRK